MVPVVLQVCCAPGPHAPSPVQAPQAPHVPLLHVRVSVPQLPHGCEEAPAQVCPVQLPHWQLAVHVCVPPVPHPCVAFGAHTPSPPHVDQLLHSPASPSHVRVSVPQLPHACEAAPAQICPVQSPHWQLAAHVCVPPAPHACIAFGAHIPSPPHVDQSLHNPASHVRVCVPQLPHACEETPEQIEELASAPEDEPPLDPEMLEDSPSVVFAPPSAPGGTSVIPRMLPHPTRLSANAKAFVARRRVIRRPPPRPAPGPRLRQ
jgi:hypothetical protein